VKNYENYFFTLSYFLSLGENRYFFPTKTIEYLHNADNQRVAKKVDGQIVEKYLWANLTTLLAVYDADDNFKQRFEYADNRMPISMTMDNEKYYLHYDQVGTLKAISNSSLEIIKQISYDTYGNILSETNPSFRVPFRFAGGLYDADTKLTCFGFRDYDAYSGKWTAKDPIDFGGGDSNLYGYVLQDPASGIDPSGLVDANSIDWDYNIKNTRHGFFDPLKAFFQNLLIGMHGYYYNSDSAFTILGHGYKGWSTSDEFYKKLAKDAQNSGKEYIELDICEIGQNEYGKNLPQKLHDISGLPVKFTEDYVVLPPFGIGQPSLDNSETARTHGWQWLR